MPKLTADQLASKSYTTEQSETIVYVTEAPTAVNSATSNIKQEGFYLFDGAKWKSLASQSYFYIPSLVLPTNSSNLPSYVTYNNGTFTVDLYSVYSDQISLAGDVSGTSRTALKSDSTSSLPVLSTSSLDYFITYFDNTVFDPSTITLSTNGILTYQIIANSTITEKTFMNIVFKEK